MFERARFIEDFLSGFYTLTELASRFGVSRRTLHKWLSRHDEAEREGSSIDRAHLFIRRKRRTRRSPRRSSRFESGSP
jgi:transposase-like protein